ncbi:MAG: 16S rRNA (uracil(1498)-N(3))-methyltransferase [Rickettsiales bacterium]|jgi:16S rRNA (uracil1498-N3)-methyltransferase|nr:16S rRNA (uracil(1498)-N(3))-methyltransferase [Rickettsiales bacterium]
MKNIPRLFIDAKLTPGATSALTADQSHYLNRVMRTDRFLAFNNGEEFYAELSDVVTPRLDRGAQVKIGERSEHKDPSGNWTFCFAPIKRIEDLIAGIVQMGAGALQPVITDRTTAHHINWDRMRKIIIENAEQSGRNSIPALRPPIPFSTLDLNGVIFGDEQAASSFPAPARGGGIDFVSERSELTKSWVGDNFRLLIGPEGGFSDAEFAALDAARTTGVSLGPTILRAETAAIALAAKFV